MDEWVGCSLEHPAAQVEKFYGWGKLFIILTRLLYVRKQQSVLSHVIDDKGTKGSFLKSSGKGEPCRITK